MACITLKKCGFWSVEFHQELSDYSKQGIIGFRKRYIPSALLGKIRLLYNIIKEEFEKKKKKNNKFSVSNISNVVKS